MVRTGECLIEYGSPFNYKKVSPMQVINSIDPTLTTAQISSLTIVMIGAGGGAGSWHMGFGQAGFLRMRDVIARPGGSDIVTIGPFTSPGQPLGLDPASWNPGPASMPNNGFNPGGGGGVTINTWNAPSAGGAGSIDEVLDASANISVGFGCGGLGGNHLPYTNATPHSGSNINVGSGNNQQWPSLGPNAYAYPYPTANYLSGTLVAPKRPRDARRLPDLRTRRHDRSSIQSWRHRLLPRHQQQRPGGDRYIRYSTTR